MTPSTVAPVAASLRSLLRGVIDYAGMYPPAKLPLADAWRNYLEYRRSADAWMLSHFVIEVDALDQLLPLAEELPVTDNPPTLAVVGRPAGTFAEWREQWESDLRAIGRIAELTNQRLRLAAVEIKVPDDTFVNATARESGSLSLRRLRRRRSSARPTGARSRVTNGNRLRFTRSSKPERPRVRSWIPE